MSMLQTFSRALLQGGEDRVQTAAAAPADAAPLREAEEQLILEAQGPSVPVPPTTCSTVAACAHGEHARCTLA